MPPESAVIDAPVATTDVTPPPQEGLKYKPFSEVLKSVETGEAATPKAEDKSAKEKEALPAKKVEVKDKATPAEKKSALDLALSEENSIEAKKEEAEPDVLAEFDEKKPNWEKARGVMKTQSEEKKALREQLKTVQEQLGKVDPKLGDTLATTTKERDDYKKKADELLDIVTKINVKYSPDYQEKFVKGREKLLERATARVKEYGGDADKFNDALALKGKYRTAALKEALENVDPIDHPRIISVLDQMQALDDEATELDKNPQAAFQELEDRRKEQSQKQSADFERAKKSEFEKVSTAISKASPLLRTVDPSETQYNEDVKSAFTGAERLFGPEATLQEQFERAVKGFRYDKVEAMLLETHKELKEARARLREYDEASPDFQGRKKPDDGKAKLKDRPYSEILEKVRQGDDDGV